MKRNLHLLVIDPQNDFCDLPDSYRPLLPAWAQMLPFETPLPPSRIAERPMARSFFNSW